MLLLSQRFLNAAILTGLFIVLLFRGCAPEPPAGRQEQTGGLAALSEPYLKHPAFSGATVGIFIQEPETREVVYQKNPHQLFIPASNLKLITTAAALSSLGPDFRFHTWLYGSGPVQHDTLRGDLYIRGSGDPTLSGRFHDKDTTRDLRNWIDSLKIRGIRYIQGDLIADANMFDQQRLGNGWEQNDLSYWYAAEISALSFNDNCLNVLLLPGDSVRAPAKLLYSPNTKYVTVHNDVVTVDKDSVTHYDYHRNSGTNAIRFFGTVSMSEDTVRDAVTIHDPPMYTITVFSELLRAAGIGFSGRLRTIRYARDGVPGYHTMTRLADYRSPPLTEIIQVINKRSQNFYAEQLLKSLGYGVTGHGSFAGGLRAELEFLAGIGVDTEHLHLADGSGLSRRNLVSPYQLVTVLRHMYESEYRDPYLASLPVAGQDASLNHRLLSPFTQDRVLGKTGYVGFVRTLSGFVRTLDGHPLIYSILVNNYTTATGVINDLQDSLLTLIASHTYADLVSETADAGQSPR